MKITRENIKGILLKGNYVSSESMKKAEGYEKAGRGTAVEFLLSEGLVTKNLVGQAIAETYKVGYADVGAREPSGEQVLRIPEAIAEKYRAVLFSDDGAAVTIATDDPEQKDLAADMRALFPSRKIVIAYALPEDINGAFVHYRKSLATRFGKIIETKSRVAPEIIDEILEDALAFRASDVHMEPQEREVAIRFRIDGVLHEAGRIPKEYYENILNRIKVQARLRIDEHFSAQDGALRHSRGGKTTDLRVSVVPILDGEKVAIRILAEYVKGFSLADLGLSERDQELISAASKKPFGMILVTGPTGSGKTTTLYALLKILNRPEVNITTIEDPVEYKILGINQIQVSQETNLTFAEGLRSIVRQDPNIILVGEIRDRETAEISVNAALTGHLLLSTFHANDAATAVPRLLDMGVEPFLLASTLELIVAQRLVRRICETCRVSVEEKREAVKERFPAAADYFEGETMTLYKGKGCTACNGTGYRGRVALFEFISITPEIEELILKNPSTAQLWKLARAQGSRSLFEDGWEKVKAGETTLEELTRVADPSSDGNAKKRTGK